MNKEQILHQLEHHVFCRLAPSPIEGVGVFAICPIPAGKDPFIGCDDAEVVNFSEEELSSVPPAVFVYAQDLFRFEDGTLSIPTCGLQRVDLSYLMNHSDSAPNMCTTDYGQTFKALRDIDAGEELTYDYSTTTIKRDVRIALSICKRIGVLLSAWQTITKQEE